MGLVAFDFRGRLFIFSDLGQLGLDIFLLQSFYSVQSFESAMVLPVEAAGGAAEFGAAGMLIDGTGSVDGPGERQFVRLGFGAAAHFVRHGGGFEGKGPQVQPLVDAEFFDEGALTGGLGQEFGVNGVEERDEPGAGFAFDQDGVGEVFEGGGIAAHGRGLRACGFSRVGAVGGQLFV